MLILARRTIQTRACTLIWLVLFVLAGLADRCPFVRIRPLRTVMAVGHPFLVDEPSSRTIMTHCLPLGGVFSFRALQAMAGCRVRACRTLCRAVLTLLTLITNSRAFRGIVLRLELPRRAVVARDMALCRLEVPAVKRR